MSLLPITLLLILLISADAMAAIYPSTTWQEATPASQGVDAALLQQAFTTLKASMSIDASVVIRHGYLIWRGPKAGTRYQLHSISKAMTSATLGELLSDSRLTLGTKITSLVPSLDDRYAGYAGITVRHLATMTSGFDRVPGGTAGYDCDAQGRCDQNTVRLAHAAPIFTPGARFRYWDDTMLEACYAYTVAAKQTLRALFSARIATPIGMQNWSWGTVKTPSGAVATTPAGHAVYNGAASAHADALNLARFGYLYLRQGVWKSATLITPAWVEASTTVQVPASVPSETAMASRQAGPGVYGYHWWRNGVLPSGARKWPNAPTSTYLASGSGANWLVVIPAWDLVIVRLGPNATILQTDQLLNQFLQQIGQALD